MGEPGAGQGGTGQVRTGHAGTGQVCTSQVKTSQAGQVSTGQNGQVLFGTRVWPYSVLFVDTKSVCPQTCKKFGCF